MSVSKENNDVTLNISSSKNIDPEELEKSSYGIWQIPYDARFPQQNQTRHCGYYYIDYHRCHILKGEDYEPSEFFNKVYSKMCPPQWISQWDEWMAEGRFPYDWKRWTS